MESVVKLVPKPAPASKKNISQALIVRDIIDIKEKDLRENGGKSYTDIADLIFKAHGTRLTQSKISSILRDLGYRERAPRNTKRKKAKVKAKITLNMNPPEVPAADPSKLQKRTDHVQNVYHHILECNLPPAIKDIVMKPWLSKLESLKG